MANTTGGPANGQEQTDAKGMSSARGDQGERIGNVAAEKAREIQSRVSERTDEAISTVGERMSSFATKLRERAPREGRVGEAVDVVADKIESGGEYLAGHRVTDIAQDVTQLVKRYPMQSLWVGLGLGFLVGNLASTRRD